MTESQIELLNRCIHALRFCQFTYDSIAEDELVEVGQVCGVDPRTAASLVDANILVYDMPWGATEHTNQHVRFPTLIELEDE